MSPQTTTMTPVTTVTPGAADTHATATEANDPTGEANNNLTPPRAARSVWDRPGWNGLPPHRVMRLLAIGGGSVLIQLGARRGSRRGGILAAIGGVLAWWGATGRGPGPIADRLTGLIARITQRQPDEVGEASDESFPASDAPAWTPTVGAGLKPGAGSR